MRRLQQALRAAGIVTVEPECRIEGRFDGGDLSGSADLRVVRDDDGSQRIEVDLAMALGGVQLLLGRKRPWLPQRARKRELPLSALDRVATMLEKRTRFLEKMTKRRCEWVMFGPARNFVGLGVTLLALGLAMPLPIPGSNMVFLIPLFIYGIGLLERDGLWIWLGHLGTLINLGLLIGFGAAVLKALEKLVHC